ncbi:hypothetical protein MI170_28750 [Mycolicibacterium goodii]|uniref:TPR repeat region-containing protein n=1 Tax=Mycolicibacterium goodii TaxID=134601 RepID=UPI001F04849D|nr:EspA/EspE family type VII secretion system effector [Mycolicibacterium goodii]ULN47207.1 hypothetical protein MI170_28750 [Mycolicibacterium goodii]
MGALDGFYSTWNKARETFGQGVPTDGSQFDHSSELLNMKASVEAAAPDDRWQGSGANAYAAANKEHAQVYEKLADLDRKMAAEVKNAANVVSVGRTNLDTAKGWVESMVNSLPATSEQDRERKLIPIAREGINKVDNIVKSATDEMRTIQGRVTGYKGEFEELTNQKFAPGGEKDGKKDEEDDRQTAMGEGEEGSAEDKAEGDVRAMLEDGDQEAASRVDSVLGGVKPGEPLTAEQNAYLSAMEAQQADMSVDELKEATDRLGDKGKVIGNSWQLMSNDDVAFGEPGENGEPRKGSFERLPDSVQKALSNNNLIGYPGGEVERQKIEAIADIVREGDTKFQTGTEIDRAMIRLSDRLMDESPVNQETVRELFTSAGRDHQIVTDHLVGHQPYLDGPEGTVPYDYDPDDFMMDIMKTGWSDNGRDAGSLFSWTNNDNGTGPEVANASAAAEAYARFLGEHGQPDLMDIENAFGMTDTLGQVNPELVKAMAHGLTPYMADIASVDGGAADNFDPLETASTRPLAKGIFTVLGTDVDAYREFNVAANQLAVEKSYEWANDVKSGADTFQHDPRMLAAATLKGLIDYGTAEGLTAIGQDKAELDNLKRSVYTEAVSRLSDIGGPYGKAVGAVGSALADSFFGDGSATSGEVKPMSPAESARFAANALLAVGVDIPGHEKYLVDNKDMFGNPVLDENGNPTKRLGTLEEIMSEKKITVTEDVYGGFLNESLDRTVRNAEGDSGNPSDAFAKQYENVARG